MAYATENVLQATRMKTSALGQVQKTEEYDRLAGEPRDVKNKVEAMRELEQRLNGRMRR